MAVPTGFEPVIFSLTTRRVRPGYTTGPMHFSYYINETRNKLATIFVKVMPILGLDVGASKIYYVVLEGDKHLAERELKIQEQSKEAFLALCQTINIEVKRQNIQISKVGVGIPGTFKDGVVTTAANFPSLEGWDLRAELSTIFDTPVTIANDAKAFTIAEATLGAGKGMKNIVGLTLGSGLGSGLFLNGALYLGQGNAGEVSEEIIDIFNLKKAEDFTSAKFFVKFGKDADQLRQEAEAGDSNAASAFEEFGKNLGVIVANIVNILDPEAMILGGGISEAFDFFIAKTKETAKNLILNPESKDVPILKTALGPATGAIGAALLAGDF